MPNFVTQFFLLLFEVTFTSLFFKDKSHQKVTKTVGIKVFLTNFAS